MGMEISDDNINDVASAIEAFLRAFAMGMRKSLSFLKYMENAFTYLDRFHTPNNALPCLRKVGLDLFVDNVMRHTPLCIKQDALYMVIYKSMYGYI